MDTNISKYFNAGNLLFNCCLVLVIIILIRKEKYSFDLSHSDLESKAQKGNYWRFAKANRIIIYLALLLISLGLSYGISLFGYIFGVVFLLFLIGVPLVTLSIANIKFGILALLFVSYFLLGINRYIRGVPLGVVLDVFLGAMLLGLIIMKWKQNDFVLAKSGVSYVVWIWIVFNFLEFFNPLASREAWIYVIRGMALLMAFYFIVLNAIDGVSFVRVLINFWIGMSLLGAVYGLFQEFHGLLPIEKEWIMADDFRHRLFYNWGRYRIFSFFNDPAVFGVLMAFTGLFCIALLPGPFKLPYKIFLSLSAGIMLLAMVYAGTRTAYAMVPAGLLIYALLTVQTRTLLVAGVVGACFAVIIFSDIRSVGPFLTTNNLDRIRSAFRPSEDPSFQVRERSQARIKPFIQSHPFGAGLGSVGTWSNRFSTNSPTAGFAPDSGYVRVAVEYGWLGLIIYCAIFGSVLVTGITNYYNLRNEELKAYVAGLVAVIFSIAIANYPQQALIQVPTVLLFYAFMAIIVKSINIDFVSK